MGDSDCCVPLPPHFVSFAWRYLGAGVSFAPGASHPARHARPGWFLSGPPTALPEETRSPPRFLVLLRSRAPLSGPEEAATPKAMQASRCGLPLDRSVGPPTGFLLSGLHHAAHELAVYASRRASPHAAQHSLPTGGLPWSGGTRTRRENSGGFVVVLRFVSPSTSPPPGLAWRTGPK